jgi:hypothetical protein
MPKRNNPLMKHTNKISFDLFTFSRITSLTRINLTVENDFDGIAPPDAGNSTVNLI